jgi:hypothetical protein
MIGGGLSLPKELEVNQWAVTSRKLDSGYRLCVYPEVRKKSIDKLLYI